MRYEGLEFDEYVARYYLNKIKKSAERGIEFKLSLTQVKNILRAKKCQLTGIPLTHTKSIDKGTQANSDVTIDRLDCSLPYQKGNVTAVAHIANQIKSVFENNKNADMKMLHSLSKSLKKRGIV
jgi:hypothetical protein